MHRRRAAHEGPGRAATSLQENCGDILADAKEINGEQRAAEDDAVVEDAADKAAGNFDDYKCSRRPVGAAYGPPVTTGGRLLAGRLRGAVRRPLHPTAF